MGIKKFYKEVEKVISGNKTKRKTLLIGLFKYHLTTDWFELEFDEKKYFKILQRGMPNLSDFEIKKEFVDEVAGSIMEQKVDLNFDTQNLSEILDSMGYVLVLDKFHQRTVYKIKSKVKVGVKNPQFEVITKDGIQPMAVHLNSILSTAYNYTVGGKDLFGRLPFKKLLTDGSVISSEPQFDPFIKETLYNEDGKLKFNTWTEPATACHVSGDKYCLSDIKLFINLLKHLMDYEEDPVMIKNGVRHIIDVLALHYQIKKASEVNLNFLGNSGTGKTTLAEILGAMYTSSHFGKCDNKTNIFSGSDNAVLKDSLVMLADEVNVLDYWEEYKGLTANDTFALKELFNNKTIYGNFALFIATKNITVEPLEVIGALPDEDRRTSWFVGKTPIYDSDISVDDLVYMTRDIGFLNSLGAFLANHVPPVSIRPFDNFYRRELIQKGTPKTKLFAIHLKIAISTGDWNWFEENGFNSHKNGTYTYLSTLQNMVAGKLDSYVNEIQNIFSSVMFEEMAPKIFGSYFKKTRKGNGGSLLYDLSNPAAQPTQAVQPIVVQPPAPALPQSPPVGML